MEQTMRLILLFIVLMPLVFWGCATSTSTTGSAFISSVVPRIQKGVTKTSQILHWLGDPYDRKQVSAADTMWLYTWSRPTANPNVVPFGHRNIGTTGYKKTLWLVIRNDIVVDYTYEEGII
jgi:hypothetical protein